MAKRVQRRRGTTAALGAIDPAPLEGEILVDLDKLVPVVADGSANLHATKRDYVSATDKLLGRSTAGAGAIEEIACTAAGRALLDDANADAQLATLGGTVTGIAAVKAADAAALRTAAGITADTDPLPINEGGTGQITAALAFGALKQDATESATGVVELATAAEVTTGTDAARAICPDQLAGSNYGKRVVGIQVFDIATDVTTGDRKAAFRVPATMNGWNLVAVAASVVTAGTTNTTDVQVRNSPYDAGAARAADEDMLSTKLTIDTGDTDSAAAVAAAVIDAAHDDVATGDLISIDVDAVSTTAPKGLYVELTFQLP